MGEAGVEGFEGFDGDDLALRFFVEGGFFVDDEFNFFAGEAVSFIEANGLEGNFFGGLMFECEMVFVGEAQGWRLCAVESCLMCRGHSEF